MASEFTGQFNAVAAIDMTPAQAEAFKEWVLQLVDNEQTGDKENGADTVKEGAVTRGAYYWFEKQQLPTQVPGGLAKTLVFFKKDDGKILGTGTVALEDRDVGIENGIEQDAFLGFIQVNRDYRKLGMGKQILAALEDHIQGHLDDHPEREGLRIALFTTNDIAKEMYKKVGYQSEGYVDVRQFGDREELFTKFYRHSAGKTAIAASETIHSTCVKAENSVVPG